MFTFVVWLWVNLFIVLINKMEIRVIPQNKILKVLMYITFPLLILVEVIPAIVMELFNSKLKGLSDKLAIRFINLVDIIRGTYSTEAEEPIEYVEYEKPVLGYKQFAETPKPRMRYKGGQ